MESVALGVHRFSAFTALFYADVDASRIIIKKKIKKMTKKKDVWFLVLPLIHSFVRRYLIVASVALMVNCMLFDRLAVVVAAAGRDDLFQRHWFDYCYCYCSSCNLHPPMFVCRCRLFYSRTLIGHYCYVNR